MLAPSRIRTKDLACIENRLRARRVSTATDSDNSGLSTLKRKKARRAKRYTDIRRSKWQKTPPPTRKLMACRKPEDFICIQGQDQLCGLALTTIHPQVVMGSTQLGAPFRLSSLNEKDTSIKSYIFNCDQHHNSATHRRYVPIAHRSYCVPARLTTMQRSINLINCPDLIIPSFPEGASFTAHTVQSRYRSSFKSISFLANYGQPSQSCMRRQESRNSFY